jgi:hypothetical protein
MNRRLYERFRLALVVFSVAAQLASLPVFVISPRPPQTIPG